MRRRLPATGTAPLSARAPSLLCLGWSAHQYDLPKKRALTRSLASPPLGWRGEPRPLGHNIPHIFPLPPCVYLPLTPHPLQRIAQWLLCLDIDTDLLRAEAFRVLAEQRQNPLAPLPPWPARLAR